MSFVSEKSPHHSVLHQTPFEKSLSRRLDKVRMVLELVDNEQEYTAAPGLSSAIELREHLEMYEQRDNQLGHVVSQYMEMAFIRKRLFRGGEVNIKTVAYSIKNAVVKSKSLNVGDIEGVKAIYSAIYAQNPLSPPYDLARPFFQRDLEAFNFSYQVLLENFRLLVAKASTFDLSPETFPYSFDHVEELISKADNLGKDISALIQKIFVVYEERLLVFEQIKARCNAICNRSRFLLGSHHPVYREIFALKNAIM